MKTIIHVNQHVIKSNRKNEVEDPVLTVKTYKSNTYAKLIFQAQNILNIKWH
jgi:hypothetical protein